MAADNPFLLAKGTLMLADLLKKHGLPTMQLTVKGTSEENAAVAMTCGLKEMTAFLKRLDDKEERVQIMLGTDRPGGEE
jgi:hypothetical protein